MDSTDPGGNELDGNGSEHEVSLPPPPPVIPPDVVPVQAEQQPDNAIQSEEGPVRTRILQVPVEDSGEIPWEFSEHALLQAPLLMSRAVVPVQAGQGPVGREVMDSSEPSGNELSGNVSGLELPPPPLVIPPYAVPIPEEEGPDNTIPEEQGLENTIPAEQGPDSAIPAEQQPVGKKVVDTPEPSGNEMKRNELSGNVSELELPPPPPVIPPHVVPIKIGQGPGNAIQADQASAETVHAEREVVTIEKMDSSDQSGNERNRNGLSGNVSEHELPLPPPAIPLDVVPIIVEQGSVSTLQAEQGPVRTIQAEQEPIKKKVMRVPIARRGHGSKGQKLPLLTNHFKVNVSKSDEQFFHYSVSICYEDGRPVVGKGIGRKVFDRLQQTYDSELGGKDVAYDGEKSLFTVGAFPRNKLQFTVMLDDVTSSRNNGNASPDGHGSPSHSDRKRLRRSCGSKTFKVEISFAAKIPKHAIASALRGEESENSQEALRVLDIILRQNAAKQGCLLVRQSFFHNDPRSFVDLGGGVVGCRGFHTSFRTTQGGLTLNIDVSTTMTVQPGPVVDFLITNQGVRDLSDIDWAKAKRMLKNLRIKASPSNQEYRITGLSEKSCREQTFEWKINKGRDGDAEVKEITVYDYFVNHRNLQLMYSADIPCINVGKPKRPTYIPLELCTLVSLQRYTKALSVHQRSSLVEKSRQKPQERMSVLSSAFKNTRYDDEPMLRSCGISINNSFTRLEGRVLSAPKLKVGNGEDLFPQTGRWNFKYKKFVEPVKVVRWAVVNFSARCDVHSIVTNLIRCGETKGIVVEPPFGVYEEKAPLRRASPVVRVEKMLEELESKLPGPPKFILCLIERKNCDIYGPWKQKTLAGYGIPTQCLAPQRITDLLLTNVLLKINAKLGGLNTLLAVEHSISIPVISKVPTIILGMDVSHGSPGQSDVPSVAAVVGSRHWPMISRYRACVRTQSPRVEMIDSLFKKVSESEDEGVIRELLVDFYASSGSRKPEQIIIFRDGVSESQFNQVLNIELDQIIEACKFLDEKWAPKFVVIVAQKNHHTKFFQSGSPDNVPPGTIIDNTVCHPKNNDFYLCAHAGMIGTTRPTHYHVLLDEVGFSVDDLQELVHSLSYVYQRSTTAVSVVAPVCYAHLAARQMGQFVKFEDHSETSSSQGGVTSAGAIPVPQMPNLPEGVRSSMFFC